MAAAITQTITIVDKSNKVVSASKQLKGVFAEAKYAYLARKAEIKSERKRKEEVELQKAIKACSIAEDEARSQVSAARGHDNARRRRSRQEETRISRSGSHSPPMPNGHVSLGQFNDEIYSQRQRQSRAPPMPAEGQMFNEDPNQQLQRRRTDQDLATGRRPSQPRDPLNRSYSSSEVDLDLAYGEFYDSDVGPSENEPLSRNPPNALAVNPQQKELSGLVLKCKSLLEEADCAGQSVKAIIAHLQENPDAMAAVALTLAEISNIASKMAPGALMALKSSAPAVMALLAAPEFLVAVGLGIGVTVVMFGGYKIIKKIKASAGPEDGSKPMMERPFGMRKADAGQNNELLDVKELDRIENWRRGIVETGPDAETGSIVSGTSVEGEFITPYAAQSMGHLPLPKEKSRKSKDKDKKSDKESTKDKKKKKHHSSSKRDKSSDGYSVDSEGTSGSKTERRGSRELVKMKKPSPLRRVFTMHGESTMSRSDS